MLTTIRNAWKIPELRRKLLFTLVIILLYRIGNVIPVPGVNVQQMSLMFSQQLSNTIFGLFDMMSGSAFSQATIFALSIQPYINASIIIQLLTIAIPALERLSKEGGEEGKKKLTKITRYTTVGLGVLMGFAYYIMLSNYNSQYSNMLLTSTGFLTALVIILTFTADNALGVLDRNAALSLGNENDEDDAFGGWTSNWAYKHMFTSTSVIYTVIYLILIVGFSYFYATIQYNPVEVANNLKKNGGFIPGFRPGRPTADFIRKVINKVTLFGAIYLGIIAVLPVLLGTIMSNTRFSFGGTSIIIVVSVALETVAAIEAQMLMRNYSGFLEK